MKIFSWMQNKLHAIRDTKKLNPLTSNDNIVKEPSKEEFSDWPRELLAIGTFGNKSVKEIPGSCNLQANKLFQDHLKDVTNEEVENHQEKSNIILDRQVPESNVADELKSRDILLDKLFKTSPTSDIGRTSNYTISDDIGGEDSPSHRINGTVLMNRGKNSHTDNTKKAIGKKSLSFLMKRMFKSEITPTSSLRDSLPEARLEKTKMDKIFRAMLNKKIFPQSFSPKACTRKCLNHKQYCMTDGKNILPEEISAGSKWVKTDSDFIVLEI